MKTQFKTLQDAIVHFSDWENCRKFMAFIRWPDGKVRCPRCGSEKVTWLAKAKVYRCYGIHPCQKFSLKVGTVFEDSPIGLEKWLPAVWLLANCKNGISSYELGRSIGVTQKTAWFMLHRIRAAMESKSFAKAGRDGGPVEIDETYVGGKVNNMHLRKRPEVYRNADKAIVMGFLDRQTRQVRTKMIPTVRRDVLMREILGEVAPRSIVFTDANKGYDPLIEHKFIHATVNHMNEYVRGQVHTQGIENFWSLLKRTLHGTYVSVEPFHLSKYAAEQVFRFNNRNTPRNPMNDAERFALAVSQAEGKRLTYAELTGKEGGSEAF